jgi:hypothetical protein
MIELEVEEVLTARSLNFLGERGHDLSPALLASAISRISRKSTQQGTTQCSTHQARCSGLPQMIFLSLLRSQRRLPADFTPYPSIPEIHKAITIDAI